MNETSVFPSEQLSKKKGLVQNMYVEMKKIYKTFDGFHASNDVNFGIEKGKLVALLGPSGSGKTTILRMIAGLDKPDSGDIFIDGQRMNDVAANKRGIGFVFQNYALFRYMTVYDNIAFGLKVKKMSKEQIRERVMELIKLIGLEGLEKRYPNQLSGGQRQRVAFARALAPEPHLLLLDEPFAAIDAKVRKELRTWLRDMITKVGITSIFVTHDQEEALEVADQIVVTNKGRVEQVGTPVEIYREPKTPFVAQFIGETSLITDSSFLQGYDIQEPIKEAVVRPEFVTIYKKEEEGSFDEGEHGVVEKISFRGSHLEVEVNVNGTILIATRTLEQAMVTVGERVKVDIKQIFALQGDQAICLQHKEWDQQEVVL